MLAAIILAFVLALAGVAQAQTTLGSAAAGMATGTWLRFDTSTANWNNGQVTQNPGGGNCTIFQYSGKAVWNPITNKYQAVAATHGGAGCPGPQNNTVLYTDATNTWTQIGLGPGGTDAVHVFDANAMAPNGTHYTVLYNTLQVLQLPNGASSWSTLATVPMQSSNPVGDSLVYFPDFQGGRVIRTNAAWGIWSINPSTGATSCLASTSVSQSVGDCAGKPQPASGWAANNVGSIYSPACQCILIGSGSVWLRMSSAGAFTNMNKTGGPSNFQTGGSDDSSNGQYITEPISGKILHLSNGIGGPVTLRFFDPVAGATGTWSTVSGTLPSAIGGSGNNAGATGAACTGVPPYGVVMCIKTNGQDWAGGTVWLYKHAAGAPINPTLTVVKAGSGDGTVAGTGINCGIDCTEQVTPGTQVTLTATHDANSIFSSWSGGGCSGPTPTCVVTVNASTTVTATFTSTASVVLTVTKAGSGSGTVMSAPAGIDCGATCGASFAPGTQVTLTATPAAGSFFASWSGGGCASANPCSPTLSANTTIVATFTLAGSSGADQDFDNRCHGAPKDGTAPSADGVVLRCFGFDTQQQLPNRVPNGTCGFSTCNANYGADFGVNPSSGLPVIDTSTKASGSGSMMMRNPVGGGTDSFGSWFTHVGVNKTAQLNQGDTIYFQYRVRWSPEMIVASNWPNGAGFKVVDMSLGDLATCNPLQPDSTACPTSCSSFGATWVTQQVNSGSNSPLQNYANCTGNFAFQGMYGANLRTQNAAPDPGCFYPNWPEPPCVKPHANEWMTMKHQIVMGTFNSFSTVLRTWMGREGQPLTMVVDCSSTATNKCVMPGTGTTVNGWWLQQTDPNTGQPVNTFKMGKIYLHPYMSNMSGSLVSGAAWYDELVISRQDIPDPGAAAPPTNPILTVTKAGTGTGTVTSSPAGIDCGATCFSSFTSGTMVTLTATPTGFAGWSGGGCSGTGTCVVTLTSDTTVIATFSTPSSVLTITRSGTGTGTVASVPAGINCGATCAASFTTGTGVTLTATPVTGTFTGWSGGGCSGTGNTCVVTLSTATTVTATFTAVTAQEFGLEWSGTGPFRRMLYWNNPFPIYPATYIFKVFPRKKTFVAGECPAQRTGYYTTFFWGNNGNFTWQSGQANTYYGMHPYPSIGGAGNCGAGSWEISVFSGDQTTGQEVQWDRWYTQAIRVRRVNATTTEHEFYYDWPDQTKVLTQTVSFPTWATANPPNPAIVMGQAPDQQGVGQSTVSWGGYPGWEEFNGIIRGIQMYSQYLSLTEIGQEIATPKSSATGAANIWYLNLNPRPSDVTDKKATGTAHNPLWDGATAIEWSSGAAPTPPVPPTGLTIRP